MASVTVLNNPSTTGNTLTVNFTTDATNITDVQITKDGTNYSSATSFNSNSATFNVSSWGNGTYNNCYLKVIYTQTSSGGSSESNAALTATILNMQYATAHEVLPNAPIDDVWKDRPRKGKGMTIPTQNCTECANGTHTATESYSADSLWSTFGQWGTIYKIKDTELVENVGVEITDFKMWRYNESTSQWVLVNDTFDYGVFYYETFWDDGSAPLNDHKILSGDKKTYKCLMDSATAGRCFHPFSAQKKWSDYGFTTNPCYVVAQMKARLIVWDENAADNRARANLCMDVGGDYWIRQGASFDDQWRHNSDMMIGYYKKITNDWRYVYMTTCPNTWDKGFPCDSTTDSGPGETTADPIELTLSSSMTCTKGVAFNINYTTNVPAVKHEMSWDGGSSYMEVWPTNNGNNSYSFSHEAITDTTWNPVSRYIRVTDSNGKTSTKSISITITEEDTPAIVLNNINNITVNKGEAFNILYSTNIPAVKHEISWNGGSEYWDKTSEIITEHSTNYKYTHEAKTDVSSYNMAIRVTDAKGNTSIKTFTITFTGGVINNFTFTKNKRLDNGIVTDSEDGTYYTTINKNSVTSGASYTISVNSANYMCICFYDSNDNYLGNNNGGFVEAHTDDWSVKALSTTFTIPSNASYLRVTATGNETQVTGTLTNNGSSTPSTPGSNLLDSNGAYIVDDFSSNSIQSNKWSYELGYVRNNELQNYTNTNAEVNNGILALKGIKDSNGRWTAASIISKGHFAFMYGKIECRAKIDPTLGSFSAFWTLGDSFEFGYHNWASPDTLGEWWAYCGEFDVMEFYSGRLTCGTFFNEREESGRVWYDNYDFNAWHTFAMEWLENGTLIFSIDGHELSRTNPTDNRAFHIPHFILINQAIGASGGTPADSTTAITQYVDWVKYYPASTENLVLNSSDFTLTAMDFNNNNCMVRPTFNDNCINKSLTWSSSDSSIISVHSGLCVAVGNGTATITATSHSGASRSITLKASNGTISV